MVKVRLKVSISADKHLHCFSLLTRFLRLNHFKIKISEKKTKNSRAGYRDKLCSLSVCSLTLTNQKLS